MPSSIILMIIVLTTFSQLTSTAAIQPGYEFEKRDQPKGIDVAKYHRRVDWERFSKSGVVYGYVMATWGSKYKNSHFKDQYSGCRKAGLICGAYIVAAPSESNGYDQADYFNESGGKWTRDGKTLPGALVLADLPNKRTCYELNPAELVTWIRRFSDEYHSKTRRYPVIVTTPDWWKECTNDDTSFGSTNALWQVSIHGRPGGWSSATLVETSNPTETKVGHSRWSGNYESLSSFAWGPE